MGSLVRSSQADEYKVSKLGRTTALKSAGGNSRMWANVPIGPNPGRSPAGRFVACRRVSSMMTSGYRYR
jgi:hypothetical protein